jgi:hypothetical protein
MSTTFDPTSAASIAAYYTAFPSAFNVYAVNDALTALSDPSASAAFTAFIAARSTAAVSTPASS